MGIAQASPLFLGNVLTPVLYFLLLLLGLFFLEAKLIIIVIWDQVLYIIMADAFSLMCILYYPLNLALTQSFPEHRF